MCLEKDKLQWRGCKKALTTALGRSMKKKEKEPRRR
jgi:hypothetical protein